MQFELLFQKVDFANPCTRIRIRIMGGRERVRESRREREREIKGTIERKMRREQ